MSFLGILNRKRSIIEDADDGASSGGAIEHASNQLAVMEHDVSNASGSSDMPRALVEVPQHLLAAPDVISNPLKGKVGRGAHGEYWERKHFMAQLRARKREKHHSITQTTLVSMINKLRPRIAADQNRYKLAARGDGQLGITIKDKCMKGNRHQTVLPCHSCKWYKKKYKKHNSNPF